MAVGDMFAQLFVTAMALDNISFQLPLPTIHLRPTSLFSFWSFCATDICVTVGSVF